MADPTQALQAGESGNTIPETGFVNHNSSFG
jgi:hypothetical protein